MADEPKQNAAETSDAEHDRGFFDLPDFGVMFRHFAAWCRANPAGVALLIVLLGVLGYFYFGVKAFLSLAQTPAQWIAASWNPENDQQHCWAIIPGAIFLVLLRWRDLTAAPKEPSNAGLWWVAAGVLAFVAGVRCVEGRYTIFALTPLCYGAVMYLFGKQVARIVLFPCVFLLFMTPLGGVVQGTAALQSKTASAIEFLCGIFGLKIYTVGATIHSGNGTFEPLEVAGGCSGIRSFMAMMTLAALYAYFVMRGTIRGLVLFACSLFFAVIGNFARVFTVVLVARFVGPNAAHVYHDWSGFVFFPVAVLAMVGVGNLLNRDWGRSFARALEPKASAPAVAAKRVSADDAEEDRKTYDY
jgi:exosortase